MGKRGIVVVVLLVVAASAAGMFWWRTAADDADALGDPTEVDLPAVSDPAASSAWLAGQGALVRSFAGETKGLREAAPDSVDECQAWTAEHLDPLGPPAAMATALASSPDEPTAEIALAHFDAVTRYLAACVQSTGALAIDEVRWTGEVLDRQLVAIG